MMSAPSAPSMPGKRRSARNSSGSPPGGPLSASAEEEANWMKRSMTQPSLRSPAERRSKSRGDSVSKDPIAPGSSRTKASSPPPPGHGYARQMESRVPKRTPRHSPRGALPGAGGRGPTLLTKDSDDRYQSWERSNVTEARRRIPPQRQELVEAHSMDMNVERGAPMPPSNVSQIGEDFGPAVVLPHTSSALIHPPSRVPYEQYGYEAEYHHATSSGVSGATTPTESMDLPMSRLRADAKTAQQVHDSRIMKLIGRRSVLDPPKIIPHRSVLDPPKIQRSAPCRAVTSSSSSSPKAQPSLAVSGGGFSMPLGEANRKLPGGVEGSRHEDIDGRSQNSYASAGEKAPEFFASLPNAVSSTLKLGADPGVPAGQVVSGVSASQHRQGDNMEPEKDSTIAKNLWESEFSQESFSASASSHYPMETEFEPGMLRECLEAPTFGLTSLDRVAPLRHIDSGTVLPLPVNEAHRHEVQDDSNSEPATVVVAASQVHRVEVLEDSNSEPTSFMEIASQMRAVVTRLGPAGLLDDSNAEQATVVVSASQVHRVEVLNDSSSEPTTFMASASQVHRGEVLDDSAFFVDDRGEVLDNTDPATVSRGGASQVDLSFSMERAADADAGQVIWPGRPAPPEQEAEAPQMPNTVAAAGSGWFEVPEQPQAMWQLGGEGPMWPHTMLQNEAGSLVVPHTWRYVPPPPQAPDPHSPSDGGPLSPPSGPDIYILSPDVNGQESVEEEPSVCMFRPVRDEEPEMGAPAKQEEAPPARALDLDAKRQLLTELVGGLTERSQKAEQALGSATRENRALNVTIEVLQRQNLVLQQQLQQFALIAQSWPYANDLYGGEALPQEALIATSSAALEQGAPVFNSGALPVETAVR